MEYLAKNIKYPATAHENGKQGRVIVMFVVKKTVVFPTLKQFEA